MSSRNPYAIPVDELDAVHVPAAQLVQEERVDTQRDRTNWNASVVPAHGGGGGSNDGDSD